MDAEGEAIDCREGRKEGGRAEEEEEDDDDDGGRESGRAGDTKIDGGWVGGPESGLGKVIARHGRQTHARSLARSLSESGPCWQRSFIVRRRLTDTTPVSAWRGRRVWRVTEWGVK